METPQVDYLPTLNRIVDPTQPVEARIASERETYITNAVASIDLYAQKVSTPEDQYSQEFTTDQAKRFLLDHGFENVVISAAENPDDLSRVLAATDRLEEKLGGGSVASTMINLAFFEGIAGSFQELLKRNDPSLSKILGRMTKSSEDMLDFYDTRIAAVEKIVEPTYGKRLSWGAHERSKLPEFLQDLMSSEDFAMNCEIWMVNTLRNEQETLPKNQYHRARQFEQLFLKNVLGFKPELATEIRRAIQGRTMKKNKDDLIIGLNDGGGMEMEEWERAMMNLRLRVQEHGIDTLHQLRENFGIVNFDRYAVHQLRRMKLVMQSDPAIFATLPDAEKFAITELMEELRKGDLVFSATATYGDYNGAFNGQARFDNRGMSIFMEVGDLSPGGFYAAIRRITSKYDLAPTTLVIGAHGLPGGMAFETSLGERMLGVPGKKDEGNASWIHVAKTRIGRIVSKLMKPHSKTGNKYIVLISCSQASPTDKGETTPETILESSDPDDKLVVSAVRDPSDFGKDDQGIYVQVPVGDVWERRRAEIYDRDPDGKIRNYKSWYVQGIK